AAGAARDQQKCRKDMKRLHVLARNGIGWIDAANIHEAAGPANRQGPGLAPEHADLIKTLLAKMEFRDETPRQMRRKADGYQTHEFRDPGGSQSRGARQGP